jgi:hypothetical protein
MVVVVSLWFAVVCRTTSSVTVCCCFALGAAENMIMELRLTTSSTRGFGIESLEMIAYQCYRFFCNWKFQCLFHMADNLHRLPRVCRQSLDPDLFGLETLVISVRGKQLEDMIKFACIRVCFSGGRTGFAPSLLGVGQNVGTLRIIRER